MRRLFTFVLFLVLTVTEAYSVEGLPALLSTLLSHPLLRGSSWSILAVSLSGDSTILEYDADRMLVPASVTKLVTSAAAIDVLGPEYRFRTSAYTFGSPDESGVMRDNIYVIGSADPRIDPRRMEPLGATFARAFADSLRTRGIRVLDGDLVMCTWPYKLECAPGVWEIGDVNTNFAPTVDAFGFNSNVCQIAVTPANNVGLEPIITVDPPYAPVTIRSTITTADPSEQGWLDYHIVPEDSVVTLSGNVPLGRAAEYLWIPVQNPALYFGHALRAEMESQGIEFHGRVTVERAPGYETSGATPLFVYDSEPLTEALSVMNKESDNFTAEYVLRAVASASRGPADSRGGLEVVRKFLKERGIETNQIDLVDGCGLARQNLMSARGLVNLLASMHDREYGPQFENTLAISGVDGTMAYRLSSPEMAGRVRAKTGTITHVCTLAGYATTVVGDSVAFAMLCNNYRGSHSTPRNVQDRILEAICNFNKSD